MSSDDFIVAIGSVSDCEVLVEKFSQSASSDLCFAEFAHIWRTTNFDLIFCGRNPEEHSHLATELLAIGKSIFLSTGNSFASRIGGLYLLYGIYFKQQTKVKSKIRITLSELRELVPFLEEVKQFREASFVFHKLLVGHAFVFCATANKYIQMNPRRQLEEEVDVGEAGNYNESRLIECDGFSMNNLGDIDLLNAKYEEIKAQLPGFGVQNASSAASNKNLVNELLSTLNSFKSDISKTKNSGIKTGKASCPELEENQGVLRRKIVNTAFQSRNGTVRQSGESESVPTRGLAQRSQRNRENK